MSWNIPPPYAVHHPLPLQWAGWWRALALLVAIIVTAAGGLWLWLHDPRLPLLTLVSVIVVTLLFIAIAGWRLFRYGVSAEHADGLSQQNAWHLAEWQQWAQSAVQVLNYSSVFPREVPHPHEERSMVNREQPFTLGAPPALTFVLEELLLPLSASLASLDSRLTVYLPCEDDESNRAAFLLAWETLGLAESQIAGFVNGARPLSFAAQLTDWLDNPQEHARLMIFMQWPDSASRHATDGAIAWLIAAADKTGPYRCRLHRPLLSSPAAAEYAARQFIRYQPLAMKVAEQWFNSPAITAREALIIECCRRQREHDATSGPFVAQPQFIPFWLGKAGPAIDWFTITLMMQMAEYHRSAQGLVLNWDDSLLLATVSPARAHESNGE